MAVVGEAHVEVKAKTAGFAEDVRKDVVDALRNAGESAAGAFRTALGKVGGMVASAASAVKDTLTAAFKVAGTAAAGFAASVVAAGASYNVLGQKSTAAFKTLLGTTEAAEKMMSDLAEFAKTSPFPRQAFISGTQQLLGFGMEAKRVIPTLDAIQQAVAATGGSAQDIEEIVHVLAQVEGTGKITANTLNMLGMRGIDAATMIGSQMGKTGEEIRSSITKGTLDATEAMDALVAGMQDRFGGAAEGLKDTWVGAADRIKGAMRDIGSAIVEPFIGFTGGGAFTEFANTIADALRKIEADVIPAITPMLENVAGHVGKVGEVIAGVFDRLGEGGIDRLLGALEGMAPIIAGIGAAFASSFGGSLPVIGNVLSGLNPIVVGLAALIATSEPLREVFAEAFKAVGPILGEIAGVVKDVVGVFGDALVPVLGAVADVFVGIAPTLGVLADVLSDVASTVGGALLSALETLMPSLGGFVTSLVNGLAPILPVIGDAISSVAVILPVIADAFSALLDALAPVVETLAEGLAEVLIALLPALPPLADAFAALVEAIVPILPPLAELIAMLLEKIGVPVLVALAHAVSVLAVALAQVATFVSKILGAGIGKLAALIGSLADALGNLDWGKVGEWLGRLPGLVGKALGSLGGLFVDLFGKAVDAVVKGFPKMWKKAIDWFGKLPGEIVKGLASLSRMLLDAFVSGVGAVVTALPGLIGNVVGFFVTLPLRILDALITLPFQLVALFTDAIVTVASALPGIAEALWSFFRSVPGLAVSALSALAGSLVGVITGAFSAVVSAATEGGSSLISFLSALPGRAVSAISSLVTTLPAKIAEVMANMVSKAQTGVADVASAVGKLPGKILGFLGDIGSAGLSIGKEFINKLGEGIARIGSFAADVATSIWNAFKDFVNVNVIDKIAGFTVSIPGPMGTKIYSGQPFGGISAFRLARGGIVPATAGGHMALIGEAGYDEVVLSTNPAYRARNRALLSRAGLSDAGDGGSGVMFGPGSVVVTFTGPLPTDEEARRIGQTTGNGIAQALAERRVIHTARSL